MAAVLLKEISRDKKCNSSSFGLVSSHRSLRSLAFNAAAAENTNWVDSCCLFQYFLLNSDFSSDSKGSEDKQPTKMCQIIGNASVCRCG